MRLISADYRSFIHPAAQRLRQRRRGCRIDQTAGIASISPGVARLDLTPNDAPGIGVEFNDRAGWFEGRGDLHRVALFEFRILRLEAICRHEGSLVHEHGCVRIECQACQAFEILKQLLIAPGLAIEQRPPLRFLGSLVKPEKFGDEIARRLGETGRRPDRPCQFTSLFLEG